MENCDVDQVFTNYTTWAVCLFTGGSMGIPKAGVQMVGFRL